jgi:hypothetical protein
VLAVQADGAEVTTIEALAAGGRSTRSSRRSGTSMASSAGSAPWDDHAVGLAPGPEPGTPRRKRSGGVPATCAAARAT